MIDLTAEMSTPAAYTWSAERATIMIPTDPFSHPDSFLLATRTFFRSALCRQLFHLLISDRPHGPSLHERRVLSSTRRSLSLQFLSHISKRHRHRLKPLCRLKTLALLHLCLLCKRPQAMFQVLVLDNEVVCQVSLPVTLLRGTPKSTTRSRASSASPSSGTKILADPHIRCPEVLPVLGLHIVPIIDASGLRIFTLTLDMDPFQRRSLSVQYFTFA